MLENVAKYVALRMMAEAAVSTKVVKILTSLATVVFSFPETTLRRGFP